MKKTFSLLLAVAFILVLFTFSACSSSNGIGIDPQTSECGGFDGDETLAKVKRIADDAALDMCEETLEWTTEIETGDILFMHKHTILNVSRWV